VLAQSPAVETSAPTQPRLFLHLQLPTLCELAFTTELLDAACACTLRLTRSKYAFQDERGRLNQGHALLARLEVEVVLERCALDNSRTLAGHEVMQIICVSDSDSQPAFRGQDLANGEGGKAVRKVANCFQRDTAISVFRY
jgi:hypothetical protein